MALVVEDGTGIVGAESYQSVANADIYIQNRTNDSSWASASLEDKERALRIATEYLDTRFGPVWKGFKSNNPD